jgi:hypothetical protein
MIRVQISLWSLAVMVESELKYPDQIDDVVNRTQQLFESGIAAAKKLGIDITQPVIGEAIAIDPEDFEED